MTRVITMDSLKKGESGTIVHIHTTGSMRRRLQDIGFLPGTQIHCEKISPLGDPAAYRIRGTLIAIRKEDSSGIEVIPWD